MMNSLCKPGSATEAAPADGSLATTGPAQAVGCRRATLSPLSARARRALCRRGSGSRGAPPLARRRSEVADRLLSHLPVAGEW